MSKAREHWYLLHIGMCPVCGADKTYRERIYGRKPKNPGDRYRYIPDSETYDGCLY